MKYQVHKNKYIISGFCFLIVTLSLMVYVRLEEPHCEPIELSADKLLEPQNTTANNSSSLLACMKKFKVPGLALAYIKNGELKFSAGFGVLNADHKTTVNTNTVFSVGSVSKVVNAALILRLVDAGILDLDVDVNRYLNSWKIPENQFTSKKKITLRHLLSHTAGLSVHGFPDFYPGEKLPTVIETLKGKHPAKTPPVKSYSIPGSVMSYSGGGTTVSQLVVTDVTGLSYPEAAQKFVFAPLGMKRSSFVNPLPIIHGNIAKAHDGAGKLTAKPRGYQAMPEMAASGLWTSVNDLARFMKALINSYHGDESFLRNKTINAMMKIVPPGKAGLGFFISNLGNGDIFFRHYGANDNYRAAILGWIEKKDGWVFLTNGTGGTKLINEIAYKISFK